ncbi:hypothetical protein AZ018_002090, partial [Klebsiella pneumoniae]
SLHHATITQHPGFRWTVFKTYRRDGMLIL